MRRRWLRLLLLLLLVAVLAALAVHQHGPGPERLLAGLDGESVDEVLIQRPNRESIRLQRRGTGWWLVEPNEVPASEFHVRELLAVAGYAPASRYPVTDMDLGHLGLDPPRARLALAGRVVYFGDEEAVDGLRYLLVDDSVHLARDRVMPLLEGAWWNLIDRHPAPAHRQLLRVESETYVLERESVDADWARDGDDPRAVPLAVLGADWLAVSALVVREVRRNPAAEAPVRLVFADGTERRFRPESEDGERRLVDVERGLAYVFDAATLDYLLSGHPPEDADALR